LHQGVHLLEKFVRDDRVRVPNPKENLQLKLIQSLRKAKSLISYIDAIGELDGKRCLIDWKTTTSPLFRRTRRAPLPRSSAYLLFLDQWHPGCGFRRVRPEAGPRDSIPKGHDFRRTAQEFGRLVQNDHPAVGIRALLLSQRDPFPQNGCVSCAHLGLCLGNEQLIEANLIRRPERAILIGLTSLWINRAYMEPNLDRRRALVVPGHKIDEILAWEKTKEREKDVRFVELGHTCARSGRNSTGGSRI